jgi:hypothetical protein
MDGAIAERVLELVNPFSGSIGRQTFKALALVGLASDSDYMKSHLCLQ